MGSNTFSLDSDVTTKIALFDVGGMANVGDTQTNDWHHLAGVFDGGIATLYIDGALASMGGVTLNYAPDELQLGCGILQGADTRHFTGTLDDVRYYNRALSAADVAAIASL